VVYLSELESKLVSSASERDLALYRYLNGRKHSIYVSPNDTESELCYNAFVESKSEDVLDRIRKVKPFKGLHYSNNFVLLVAATKIDPQGENGNLSEYLSSRGCKYQLIVNCALGSGYRVATKIETPIDGLANKIEGNARISEEDIQKCLSEIKDLYDLFVLEKAIAKSIFQEKESLNITTYESLFDLQEGALKRIEFMSFLLLFVLFAYFLYLIVPMLVKEVVEHWDTLEPLAYILDKAVIVVILLTGVVIATKIQLVKNKAGNFIAKIVYGMLGINYAKYQQLHSHVKPGNKGAKVDE